MITHKLRAVDPFYIILTVIAGIFMMLFLCAGFVTGELQRVVSYVMVKSNPSPTIVALSTLPTPAFIPTGPIQSPSPNLPTATILSTATARENRLIPAKAALTSTLTPTSTPIYGVVIADALNVRWGPSIEYGYVGAVYKDDEVVILGSNSDKSWLKIQLSEAKAGWVNARFIDIIESNIALAVLPTPPLPSGASGNNVRNVILREFNFGRELNVNAADRSVKGQLGPFQEHWYSFIEVDPETIMAFIFKPNINYFADHFIGHNVEAFLYDQHQIGVEWLPGERIPGGLIEKADSLPHIGAGTYPGLDWDGDLGSGELVWRGGPLVPGTRYYFRFVNRTPETLIYCLSPGEVRFWAC